MKKLCALLLVLLAAGCAEKTNFPKYSALVNQGLLPLSTTNAYLGSNLFIAEEAERSHQLYNFLGARGGPTAMELDESAGHAPHMLMFYPRDKEVYAGELTQLPTMNGGMYREWVIRGPYAIERKDYKDLAKLETSFAGEPLFFIGGHEMRFRFQQNETQSETAVKTVLVPVLPSPTPTPKPKKKPGKIIVQKGDSKPVLQDFKPLNSDQQAIRMSQGYAERASNGDVVHTVANSTETLDAIAKWYTGSAANAKAIADANIIQPGAALIAGMRIMVPLALLKNEKVMPAGK